MSGGCQAEVSSDGGTLGYNPAMPELPEVEVLRRSLEPHLVGDRIDRTEVHDLRLREPVGPSSASPAGRCGGCGGAASTC